MTAKQIYSIARKHSVEIEDRGDLKARNTDSQDYVEVSVWNIEAMIKEAYELGRKEADGKAVKQLKAIEENRNAKDRIFQEATKAYKEKKILMVLKRTSVYTREQIEKMTDRQISNIIASYPLEEN